MPTRENGHEPETIISASVKVEGDFVSQGNVLIEGVVEGSLKTDKDLRVGERARISANVVAANATVAGEVRGNVSVTERLELEPTARVYGDVRTKVLVVASGATINGSIGMGQDSAAEEKSPKQAAKAVPKAETKEVPATAEEAEEKEEAKEKRTVNAFFTK